MRKKKAGILTKLIVLALLVYAAVTLIQLRAQIDAVKEKRAELQEMVDEKESENMDIQYALDHYDDFDTVERVAREAGYGMPGEILVLEAQ